MKLFLLLLFMFAFPSQAETIKVASWNIAWLGSHEYNRRTGSDYLELARYAKQLNADVLSLQEVESEQWARKVFGDDYDYYFTTNNWVQRVGVAIKKSKGYSVTSQEYISLDVGRVRRGMDVTISKDDKQLRLLAVHLKSGCFEKPLDDKTVEAMSSSSNKDKKSKTACVKLSKQIKPLESWIDARAKEGVSFIVLGDFNRRFNRDIAFDYPEDAGLWQAIDDDGLEDMWAPTTSAESKCWGGYYKDFIDHVVFDPKAKKKYVEGSFNQLVYDGKYTRELSNALSDHCPISVELNL